MVDVLRRVMKYVFVMSSVLPLLGISKSGAAAAEAPTLLSDTKAAAAEAPTLLSDTKAFVCGLSVFSDFPC